MLQALYIEVYVLAESTTTQRKTIDRLDCIGINRNILPHEVILISRLSHHTTAININSNQYTQQACKHSPPHMELILSIPWTKHHMLPSIHFQQITAQFTHSHK